MDGEKSAVIFLLLAVCSSGAAGLLYPVSCPNRPNGTHLRVSDKDGHEIHACDVGKTCKAVDNTRYIITLIVSLDKLGQYRCEAIGPGGSLISFNWTTVNGDSGICVEGKPCPVDCPKGNGRRLVVSDVEGHEIFSCDIGGDCLIDDHADPHTQKLYVPLFSSGDYRCDNVGGDFGDTFNWTHKTIVSAGDENPTVMDGHDQQSTTTEIAVVGTDLPDTTSPPQNIMDISVAKKTSFSVAHVICSIVILMIMVSIFAIIIYIRNSKK